MPARQRAVGAEFRTGLTIMAVSPLPYVGAMSSTTTDDLSASADDAKAKRHVGLDRLGLTDLVDLDGGARGDEDL